MMTTARTRTPAAMLLGVLLLLAAPLAMAQNVRTANGNADASERAPSETSAEDEARDSGAAQRRARNGGRADEANTNRVPRWHSMLPGMFR